MKIGVSSPFFTMFVGFCQFAVKLLSILEGFANFRKCWVKFWTILVVFCLFLSVFVVLILIVSLSILNDFSRFTTILC